MECWKVSTCVLGQPEDYVGKVKLPFLLLWQADYKHKLRPLPYSSQAKSLGKRMNHNKNKMSKHVPKLELVYIRIFALKDIFIVRTMPLFHEVDMSQCWYLSWYYIIIGIIKCIISNQALLLYQVVEVRNICFSIMSNRQLSLCKDQ